VKKRVFYVINLDKKRILMIGTIFTGMVFFSFLIGFRLGNDRTNRMDPLSFRVPEPERSPFDPEGMEPGKRETMKQSDEAFPPEPEDRNDTATPERRNVDTFTRKDLPREQSPVKSETRRKKRETVKKKTQRKAERSKKKTATKKKSKSEIVSTKKEKPKAEEKPKHNVRAPILVSDSVKLANYSDKANDKGGYTLQTGAFSDRDSALRMKAALEKHGIHGAYITEISGTYRVRVGKSLSDQQADALKEKLKQKKFASFLVNDRR